MKLISVLVVTYNSSKTIIETLDSVFNQDYDKIQLIISDDFSKDDTIEKCKKWISEHEKRFDSVSVYSSPENKGVPANCNNGLQLVQGEWYKIMPGDDVLCTDCISTYVDFVSRNNVDIVLSDVYIIDEDSIYIDRPNNYFPEFLHKISPSKRLAVYCKVQGFLNAPTWFMRTDAIRSLGGYDEKYRYIDDNPLFMKALEKGLNTAYLPAKTVKYRVNSLSITSSYSVPLIQNLISIRKDIRSIYANGWLYQFYLIDEFLQYESIKRKNEFIKFSRIFVPSFWIKKLIIESPNYGFLFLLKRFFV